MVKSLYTTGEESWQAGIFVHTPVSVSVAIRAEPFAFVVFDSHLSVVAISGRSAGKETFADYLVHLFLQRFGMRLRDAALCLLERVSHEETDYLNFFFGPLGNVYSCNFTLMNLALSFRCFYFIMSRCVAFCSHLHFLE